MRTTLKVHLFAGNTEPDSSFGKAACGITGGFGRETPEVRVVGPSKRQEITCQRCTAIADWRSTKAKEE